MSLWKWNDVEYDVDLEDVEFTEKYEDAFNKMGVTEKKLQKTGKLSDITRAYCLMFYELFDNIFGDGAAKSLMGDRLNCRICEECYDSFISFCNKQASEMNKKRSKMYSKYKPKGR